MARRAKARKTPDPAGNFVSEWFGHRVYPSVKCGPSTLGDQKTQRCPFLTAALHENVECVKSETSKGVCTISSTSNGPRQDWLVCPHRALVPAVVDDAARRLFCPKGGTPFVVPAPTLRLPKVQSMVAKALKEGVTVVTYLRSQLGGEVSISKTERSPEMSFDMTMVQLLDAKDGCAVGRYGIIETQTMDFHGSYRHAVKNVTDALRLHGKSFHKVLGENVGWLCEGVEGPNIANVFKRTFYQMIFKFRLAELEACAGCVLAIPTAVWDSWQRHLGKPELVPCGGSVFEMRAGEGTKRSKAQGPAWIYVFEPRAASDATPNPIRLERVVATDADSVAHFALRVAPEAAVGAGGSADSLPARILSRLTEWWPALVLSSDYR